MQKQAEERERLLREIEKFQEELREQGERFEEAERQMEKQLAQLCADLLMASPPD
jgi:hypothetical protein